MAASSSPQSADRARGTLECRRIDVGPRVVRVSLRGDLDAVSASQVDRMLRTAQDDEAIVVVDLDQLDSVDDTAAAVLRDAGERARRHGRRIVAVNAQPRVQETLERLGVERELKLVSTRPSPLPAVPAPPPVSA
jgi:anti-anti-sigma factor